MDNLMQACRDTGRLVCIAAAAAATTGRHLKHDNVVLLSICRAVMAMLYLLRCKYPVLKG